jgi:3-oxoacyl-[acyl-carrier protein] reductase
MRETGVVLVTGAAGAIGSATVRAFLDAGYRVAGIDVAPCVGEPEWEGYAGIPADVRDPGELARAVERARRLGPLRHVVSVAGGALPEEPPTQDDPLLLELDSFRASVELNLTSHFALLRAVLPELRRSEGSDRSVLLTSSWNALTGCGMPAYSAAKAGLIGMMNALAMPLGREGIRINVVAPGTVRTPRTERIWAGDAGHWERLEASTALGRLGTPDDVARAYLALATQLTHVTGQVLVVDGGQMVKR